MSENKLISIYFHGGCFDGVMSAALLCHFFDWRGVEIDSLHPCYYEPNFPAVWEKYPFQTPFAIVDFRYHPQATWWFDHHATTFLEVQWETDFKESSQHYFNPHSPSCFGMTLNFLKKTYAYQSSLVLQELEPWADKIDGAQYASAAEAIEVHSWVQELALLLRYYDKINPNDRGSFQREVIESVASGDIRALLNNYRRAVDQLKEQLRQSLSSYQKMATMKGKVSFVDKTNIEIMNTDFISYYLFPEIPYTVSIDKNDHGYHVHAGHNPWTKSHKELNLGELMKKYGGGGHLAVGGAEAAGLAEALKISKEIVEYVNQNG